MTNATVAVQAEATSVRIAIAGEVDIENAAEVERQIVEAIGNTADEVLIDLTHLVYMDSSGLRILFGLAARLDMLQIKLQVIAPPGTPTRRVLELAGFESM